MGTGLELPALATIGAKLGETLGSTALIGGNVLGPLTGAINESALLTGGMGTTGGLLGGPITTQGLGKVIGGTLGSAGGLTMNSLLGGAQGGPPMLPNTPQLASRPMGNMVMPPELNPASLVVRSGAPSIGIEELLRRRFR